MLYHSQNVNSFLKSRFLSEVTTGSRAGIDQDFYADLLFVFHNPELFKPAQFQKYSLEIILLYLRKTHEFYLQKHLSEIELVINGISKNYPPLESWRKFLNKFFVAFADELAEHIGEEEEKLFPYLDALLTADKSQNLTFGITQKIELLHFLAHHDDELENKLKAVIDALEKKADQMPDVFSLRMLLAKLKTLEIDLRIHGLMEDQVLMPIAMKLEGRVLGNQNLTLHG